MALELVPIHRDHVPELGRICYEAFAGLHDRHGVPRDLPDLETGRMVVGLCASRTDFAGVAALLDGSVVGSNFLCLADEVAGVGPITVDPSAQSRGVGRALMQWAVDEARRRGVRETRLFQEAVNTTSLSLYTSLGFAWRDSAALMQAIPADDADPTVRPLTPEDLPGVDRLMRAAYGSSRMKDAAQLLAAGVPGIAREREGRLVAYQLATLFGHAAAETFDDLLAMPAQLARLVPAEIAIFICPLSAGAGSLFRRAMSDRHRTVKALSYMSLDAFTPPRGPQFPSMLC